MDLKAKLETKEKRIMGLTTENASLKAQNVLLDKRTKELNEICQKQEKELIEVKKESAAQALPQSARDLAQSPQRPPKAAGHAGRLPMARISLRGPRSAG